jgi:hypothetical protein
MAFKIKDGIRVGVIDIFNNSGSLLVNAPTATKWLTARDLSLTGDATATLSSVDGTGNVSAALTLATVNSNVGSFGSSTAIPVITVNAKGLITAVTTDSISTSIGIAGSTGTGTVAGGGTLTVTGGTGVSTSASGSTITVNIGQSVSTSDSVTFSNLTLTGNLTVNGTTTTINSTTVSVDDITLELGSVETPSDTTANGGGIVLKGATDKTILWDSANSNWTGSEHFNIANTKVYKINNVSVLSATTLGSSVVTSSLTTVGTIGTGTWQGTIIGPTYGGTGVNNGSYTITVGGNVSTAGAFTTSGAYGVTLTATNTTSVTLPTTGTLATLANAETFTNKTLGAHTLTTSGNTDVGYNVAIQTGISTTVQTAVDTWAATSYRSAKYLVQITQGTDYQTSEIMVIHNGTTTSMTEYAVLETNGSLAAINADISSGNVRLLVTMSSSSAATINIIRQNILV